MEKVFNIFRLLPALILVTSFARAGTSDTIHVRRYSINIDTMDYSGHFIRANTTLDVVSRMNNTDRFALRLFHLTPDSVTISGMQLNFSYNDTLLAVYLPSPMNANDSLQIRVFYSGQPLHEASFGGFYFSGNYAFNLGVGINTDPHNFGSAWFPCVDEFTDKSLYEFYIKTPPNYKAFCNGILQSSILGTDSLLTWYWKMDQPIPSYLASMAIAPFYTIHRNYSGVPVELAVLPGDTANTLATFVHLPDVLQDYITAYGPYPFDKVGFVAVPFNGGAMEHATSIHIGKVFIDGTLNYETLWAHELSHMWWGDLVTCSSEQDMWLNEGFASFNEYMMREWLYGKASYMNAYRTNHRNMCQYLHLLDGGYFALDAIPHDITYGYTVYNRGADIIHTLRGWLGDSLFFAGCKYYLTHHAYGNADSQDLVNDFSSATGVDLSGFYDGWVNTAGFVHFSLDSVVSAPSPTGFDVTVTTRQKQKGNNHIFSMPVECTFSDGTQDTTVVLLLDSAVNTRHLSLGFNPLFTALDRNEKISDAIVDNESLYAAQGTYTLPNLEINLTLPQNYQDTSLVRIEHHFVAPDNWLGANPGIQLSTYHYFSVDGLFALGFSPSITFTYDGRTGSPSAGHLDDDIITGAEDSLVLLYRSGPGTEWRVIPSTQNFLGSHSDKRGTLTADSLMKGEYTFGYRDFTLTTSTETVVKTLNLYPVPSGDRITICPSWPVNGNCELRIWSSDGRLIQSMMRNIRSSYTMEIEHLEQGIYLFEMREQNGISHIARFIVAR